MYIYTNTPTHINIHKHTYIYETYSRMHAWMYIYRNGLPLGRPTRP